MTADEYVFKVRGSVDVEWLRREIFWHRERMQRTDEFYRLAVDYWISAMRALVAARDAEGAGSAPMFELDAQIGEVRKRLAEYDEFASGAAPAYTRQDGSTVTAQQHIDSLLAKG